MSIRDAEVFAIKNKNQREMEKHTKNILKQIGSSDDPLRELGPGISSYHQLLVILFGLFFILTLMHIPALKRFSNGTFYDEEDGWIVGLSLGNLGFSQTNCIAFSMIKGNTG